MIKGRPRVELTVVRPAVTSRDVTPARPRNDVTDRDGGLKTPRCEPVP